MRMPVYHSVALVLLLSIGYSSGFAAEPKPKVTAVLKLLPKDALFVVSVPDISKALKTISISEFGKLWNEPETQTFLLPVWHEIKKEYTQFRGMMPVLPDAADIQRVFTKGIAIAVLAPQPGAKAPGFCAAFNVGDPKAASTLLKALLGGKPLPENKVTFLMGPTGPAFIYEKGILLVASSGGRLKEMHLQLNTPPQPATSLVSTENWKATQALLVKKPIASLYLNFEQGLNALKPLLKMSPPKQQAAINSTLAKMNINSAKGMAIQFQKVNATLRLDAAIAIKGAGGLAPAGAPLSADVLKGVPSNASFCSINRFNMQETLKTIRGVISDEQKNQFEQGLAKAKTMLGVDLELLMNRLGDTWISYGVGGNELMGMTSGMALSVNLKEEKPVSDALKKLGESIFKLIIKQNGSTEGFELRELNQGKRTITYLNIPFAPLSPSWAVTNKHLIFTTSVSAMRRALRQLDATTSIVENSAFKEALERVTEKPLDLNALPEQFSFENARCTDVLTANLRYFGKSVIGGFQIYLIQRTMWGGGLKPGEKTAKAILDKLDFALLPSSETISKHLKASASVYLRPKSGWVFRSELGWPSPANLISKQNITVIVPILAGLTLPVLAKARENARRTACKSNLSQMGKACLMYADVATNLGRYPRQLEDTFPDYIMDDRVFHCPSAGRGHQLPVAKGKITRNDYIYIPGSTDTMGTNVIAFCRCENHSGNGVNVLIGAGAVEWMTKNELRESVLRTCKDLGISLEAQDNGPAGPPTKAQLKSYDQALKDLASEDYGTRKLAQKKLTAAGKSALKTLKLGTKSKDLNTRTISVGLIGRIKKNQSHSKEHVEWVKEMRKQLGIKVDTVKK